MSKSVGGIPIAEEEPDQECQECGEKAECRPYGSGGKQVCFKCAMKDKEGTERRMAQVLFGEKVN